MRSQNASPPHRVSHGSPSSGRRSHVPLVGLQSVRSVQSPSSTHGVPAPPCSHTPPRQRAPVSAQRLYRQRSPMAGSSRQVPSSTPAPIQPLPYAQSRSSRQASPGAASGWHDDSGPQYRPRSQSGVVVHAAPSCWRTLAHTPSQHSSALQSVFVQRADVHCSSSWQACPGARVPPKAAVHAGCSLTLSSVSLQLAFAIAARHSSIRFSRNRMLPASIAAMRSA